MIEIAIADKNPVFCQGLKTMLDQIENFRVRILIPDRLNYDFVSPFSIDILMVDEDLYMEHVAEIKLAEKARSSMKTIILTMDHENLFLNPVGLEMVYKGCGKSEFAEVIMNKIKI